MAKISEETTKGLVAEKLKNIMGYPSAQNTKVDGITWFKEDSYKGTAYDCLTGVFAKATKKQTLSNLFRLRMICRQQKKSRRLLRPKTSIHRILRPIPKCAKA